MRCKFEKKIKIMDDAESKQVKVEALQIDAHNPTRKHIHACMNQEIS